LGSVKKSRREEVLTKARSTQEVFDNHRDAMLALDFERLMADYADDSILLTLDGAFVGREAIQGFFAGMLENFPNITIAFERIAVEDDTVLIQWSADSDVARFPTGVATFIIRDDRIRRQGEWFIVEPK